MLKHVSSFFLGLRSSFDVVLLNAPAFTDSLRLSLLSHVLPSIRTLVVADGGANFLYSDPHSVNTLIPDVVLGDFDSIKPHVQEFYASRTEVIHLTEQDSTDLEKAMRWLAEERAHDPAEILVLGGFGGRRDHEFAEMNSLLLHCQQQERHDLPCPLMLDPGNITRVLRPNCRHEISILPEWELRDGIGLIPISGKCTVETNGLLWDLGGEELEFGGLLSSSNELQEGTDAFTVKADQPILCVTRLNMSKTMS